MYNRKMSVRLKTMSLNMIFFGLHFFKKGPVSPLEASAFGSLDACRGADHSAFAQVLCQLLLAQCTLHPASKRCQVAFRSIQCMPSSF